MRSIKFPKMFNATNTNIWKSNEYNNATMQNVELLLLSERGELFGDPYYGLLLKHYLYSQNSVILRDIIIDMIYTLVALFIPQVKINRNDIEVIQDLEKGRLYCRFSGVSQIDYTVNTYDLVLYQDTEFILQ